MAATRNEVFYIDDSGDDRFFVEHNFTRGEYTYVLKVFETGIAAIMDLDRRVARGEKLPDLVVADYYMPVMDGPEFLRSLRANDAFQSIKLAICSGGDDPADLETAKAAGAEFVLAKPLDLRACEALLSS